MIHTVRSGDESRTDLIPVADGTYYTQYMTYQDPTMDTGMGTFEIMFYDENKKPVKPDAGGTITPKVETVADVWHRAGEGDSQIMSEHVDPALCVYITPTFISTAMRGRVTLENISGAAYFKAYFPRW